MPDTENQSTGVSQADAARAREALLGSLLPPDSASPQSGTPEPGAPDTPAPGPDAATVAAPETAAAAAPVPETGAPAAVSLAPEGAASPAAAPDRPSAQEAQAAPRRGGALAAIAEFAIIAVLAVVFAWLIINFVARPYGIPSGSMEDTIQVGDRVLSERVTYYFGTPQQGQIVTFKEVDNPDRTLIKRVIAVAGQTVDLVDGQVYVDGEPLDEPYTQGKPSYPEDAELSYPYTIPEGCIWCMGDNRTDSSDSRSFGPVPVENVTGHAFVRYWPFDSFGLLE